MNGLQAGDTLISKHGTKATVLMVYNGSVFATEQHGYEFCLQRDGGMKDWKKYDAEDAYPIGTAARHQGLAVVAVKQEIYSGSQGYVPKWFTVQFGRVTEYATFADLQKIDRNKWEIIYTPEKDLD